MEHTKAYIDGLLKMMRENAHAAGIKWDNVKRVAVKLAKASVNSYEAYRAFCDYLYFKQLEN